MRSCKCPTVGFRCGAKLERARTTSEIPNSPPPSLFPRCPHVCSYAILEGWRRGASLCLCESDQSGDSRLKVRSVWVVYRSIIAECLVCIISECDLSFQNVLCDFTMCSWMCNISQCRVSTVLQCVVSFPNVSWHFTMSCVISHCVTSFHIVLCHFTMCCRTCTAYCIIWSVIQSHSRMSF